MVRLFMGFRKVPLFFILSQCNEATAFVFVSHKTVSDVCAPLPNGTLASDRYIQLPKRGGCCMVRPDGKYKIVFLLNAQSFGEDILPLFETDVAFHLSYGWIFFFFIEA